MIKSYLQNLWEDAKFNRKRDLISLLGKGGQNIRILDCGCDQGYFTKEVIEKLHSKNVFGIEINKKAIDAANKNGVKVKSGDLNKKFPFESDFFDIVYSDQVIEHLHDLDNFIEEMKRVLKPGGSVVISTENLASWHNVFAMILGLQPFSGPTPSNKYTIGFHPITRSVEDVRTKGTSTEGMPPHIKILTVRALEKLVTLYGFKIEQTFCYGYIPFPPFLAEILCRFDKYHGLFVTVKARKSK